MQTGKSPCAKSQQGLAVRKQMSPVHPFRMSQSMQTISSSTPLYTGPDPSGGGGGRLGYLQRTHRSQPTRTNPGPRPRTWRCFPTPDPGRHNSRSCSALFSPTRRASRANQNPPPLVALRAVLPPCAAATQAASAAQPLQKNNPPNWIGTLAWLSGYIGSPRLATTSVGTASRRVQYRRCRRYLGRSSQTLFKKRLCRPPANVP
jgi:hypothetical protein